MMYNPNILSAIKKMTIKEFKDFLFENFYRQIGFTKENSYSMKHPKKTELVLLATKLLGKIPDAGHDKEYYIFGKKNTKLVKQSKIITQKPKTIKSPNMLTYNWLV